VEKKKNSNLTPEQQEKLEIEKENKILKVLMPAVGGAAFILGLVGFILTITVNVAIAIFLLIVAILGAGGIAYGVYHLILKQRKKLHKEEVVPSETPNEKPAA
jgi:hypothetical protein